jgi:glucan phosphorylase
MVNKKIPDALQEIDDTEFFTAHEQLIKDTMESKPVRLDKKNSSSQRVKVAYFRCL